MLREVTFQNLDEIYMNFGTFFGFRKQRQLTEGLGMLGNDAGFCKPSEPREARHEISKAAKPQMALCWGCQYQLRVPCGENSWSGCSFPNRPCRAVAAVRSEPRCKKRREA
jgi:hypothetical protein